MYVVLASGVVLNIGVGLLLGVTADGGSGFEGSRWCVGGVAIGL